LNDGLKPENIGSFSNRIDPMKPECDNILSDFDNTGIKNCSVIKPVMEIVTTNQSFLEKLSSVIPSTGVLNKKLTVIFWLL
jgi:hypothetical protein